jgi:CIC family chloride channel protein
MGAVFASATRGPLTALASVVELSGDFTLTLPVMFAVAIATTVSRALSYGTIYTTKLLRRGIDIDRPHSDHAFTQLTVADAMHRFPQPLDLIEDHTPAPGTTNSPGTDVTTHRTGHSGDGAGLRVTLGPAESSDTLGPLTRLRHPQALFSNESLAQALRQLVLYGRDGLPVLSTDGHHIQGWITNQEVLRAAASRLTGAAPDITAGHLAAEWAHPHPTDEEHDPRTALPGYQIAEYTIADNAPAVGRRIGELNWPDRHIPVSVLHLRRLCEPDPQIRLQPGDRINVLVPVTMNGTPATPTN